MSFGFSDETASYPKPSFERLPGRKFSIRISDEPMRFRSAAVPPGSLRSSTTLFLLRFNPRKKVLHVW